MTKAKEKRFFTFSCGIADTSSAPSGRLPLCRDSALPTNVLPMLDARTRIKGKDYIMQLPISLFYGRMASHDIKV